MVQIFGPKIWTENLDRIFFEKTMIGTGLNRNAPELELLFLQMVKFLAKKVMHD